MKEFSNPGKPPKLTLFSLSHCVPELHYFTLS